MHVHACYADWLCRESIFTMLYLMLCGDAHSLLLDLPTHDFSDLRFY